MCVCVCVWECVCVCMFVRACVRVFIFNYSTHTPTHQRSNTQKRIHHTQKILNWWYRHIHTVKYSGNSWTICRIGCSDGRRSLQPLNGRLEWSRNSRAPRQPHGADLRAVSRFAANPRGVAPYPIFQDLTLPNVFQNEVLERYFGRMLTFINVN